VCGWQVKLCDPLVTRGPYLSALEIRSLYIERCINLPFYFYFLLQELLKALWFCPSLKVFFKLSNFRDNFFLIVTSGKIWFNSINLLT